MTNRSTSMARRVLALAGLLWLTGCACTPNMKFHPTYDIWKHRARLETGFDFYENWWYGCPTPQK